MSNKENRIQLRITEKTKKFIKKCAEKTMCSMSAYIIRAVYNQAKKDGIKISK